MLELKITHMVMRDADEMPRLSGSQAELGRNAGKITWENSRDYASDNPLLKTVEQVQAAKDYFKTFGAWSDEERAAWTDKEVQTLVVQFIAGNIREMQGYNTYEEYEAAAHEGLCSGEVYRGDDGEFYASLTS